MNLKGKGREKKRDRTSSKDEVTIVVEGSDKDAMVVDEIEGKPITTVTTSTTLNESPSKSRKLDSNSNIKSPPRYLIDPLSLFSEPLDHIVSLHSGMTTPGGVASSSSFTANSVHLAGGGIGGDKLTLGLGEVTGAYNEMQINQMALRANGMKNWRGGLKRVGRLGLI